MFERFTDRARQVLVVAQEEARLLQHASIGTEHVLLGLVHQDEGVVADVLGSFGVTLEAARDRVARIVGSAGGPGHEPRPFTPRAKKVLELSLREALQLGHDHNGPEHLLLGVVREAEGVAAQVLVGLGADLGRVRQQVVRSLADREGERGAAGAPGWRRAVPHGSGDPRATPLVPPSGDPPDCPHCRASLPASARLHRLALHDEAGADGLDFLVVYCRSCGRSLAFRPL